MRQLGEINRDIERCKQEQEVTDDMEMFLYYEEILRDLLIEKEQTMSLIFQNT